MPFAPEFDFGGRCESEQGLVSGVDWQDWDGDSARDLDPEDLLRTAAIFMEGKDDHPFNYPLARKILTHVFDEMPAYRGRAAYLLGRLSLNEAAQAVRPLEAIAYFEEAERAGYGEASTALARLYRDGKLIEADRKKARAHFERGIALGHTQAKIDLAILLSETPDLGGSSQQAVSWINSAQDDLVQDLIYRGGCNSLGGFADIFGASSLPSHDLEKKVAWLAAAARAGSESAMVQLARHFAQETAAGAADKAKQWYTAADEAGYARGRIEFARFLLENANGESGADLDNALRLLAREAERGNVEAHYVLSDYASGDMGFPPQSGLETAQLRRALSYPNPKVVTYERLAHLVLETGEGEDRVEEALELLAQAVELDSVEAIVDLLELLEEKGLSDKVDYQPVTLLRSAALRGSANAMRYLHDVYACGLYGESQDREAAKSWRQRAAEAGDVTSLKRLAEEALLHGGPENLKSYFEYMKTAANAGDPEAKLEVAQALRLGIGTAPDLVASKAWQLAAFHPGEGLATALTHLARKILKGQHTGIELPAGAAPLDLVEGLLTDAMAAGSISAAYDLGKFYLDEGRERREAKAKAVSAFLMAAEAGHGRAMWYLATFDDPAAELGGVSNVAWAMRSAASGYVVARIAAAESLEEESEKEAVFRHLIKHSSCDVKESLQVARSALRHVPALEAEALALVARVLSEPLHDEWALLTSYKIMTKVNVAELAGKSREDLLLAAVEIGSPLATFDLGKAYFQGRFGPPDQEKAKVWLRKALDAGEVKALPFLVKIVKGMTAQSSMSIEALLQDPAFLAVRDSAKKGDLEAIKILFELYKDMGGQASQDGDEARVWAERAAEAGISGAMMYLFSAYANGADGFSKSDEKSTYWLGKAANANHPDAFQAYAVSLQLGVGAPPDPEAARYWLKKSLETKNER
ncbi:hypothetical protein [Roseibium sp.]|uniref:tetratricopeptide repeat protein n=1 Tax=Roseibium sp. TaxID=1936156 RepID=UPI003A97FEFB